MSALCLQNDPMYAFTPNDLASDIQDDADRLFDVIRDGKHKKFICNISECRKVFRFHSEMQRHIASHSSFRPHKCTFNGCNREFKRTSALENHIRSQHTGEAPLVCPHPECGLRFSTEAKFRYHVVSHLEEKPHKCGFPNCDKSFMTLSQLKQHEKSPSVHKKLDIMAQLKEKGPSDLISQLGLTHPYGDIQNNGLGAMIAPVKKVKYDLQSRRLNDLLVGLQPKPAMSPKVKTEPKVEPLLQQILYENELLRQKLENSEQMLTVMKQQIDDINTKVAAPRQIPMTMPVEESLYNFEDRKICDVPLAEDVVDSYLIHDTFSSELRPLVQEFDFMAPNQGDDKLCFFFSNFLQEDFSYAPIEEKLEK